MISPNTSNFLFVYGTLLSDLAPSMLKGVLSPFNGVALMGKSEISGAVLYDIDGTYPGIVLTDNPEDKVLGEVYSMENPENILNMLDIYEEVHSGEYIRSLKIMKDPQGWLFNACVYQYNQP